MKKAKQFDLSFFAKLLPFGEFGVRAEPQTQTCEQLLAEYRQQEGGELMINHPSPPQFDLPSSQQVVLPITFFVFLYAQLCIRVFLYLRIRVFRYSCICVLCCVFVHLHIFMYSYSYFCLCKCSSVYLYLHNNICVVCIYVFVFVCFILVS